MNPTPFSNLSQDLVIDAIESLGYMSDLRVFALNSYENRVYQVGIEDSEPLIAKFYRPERWTKEQILEEHQFSLSLTEAEIPVISPIFREDVGTLFEYGNYWFALYPRRGGHAPNLDDLDVLYRLGQHLGRIHAIGSTTPFQYRPELSITNFGINSREYLLANNFIPANLIEAYATLSQHILDQITQIMSSVSYSSIRLHGDCHPGNILTRPDSIYLVDLDDSRMGPAVQDLWMLLSGERHEREAQLEAVIEGYEEFFPFNTQELALIESLRALRLMHYAYWLAQRWNDPAFPQAFPWFNTERYWAEHILSLREQYAELSTPPLKIGSARIG
ncbi:serine/threonine protein kinase [Teredinibacter sp. KSP-S5-2]|uniref:serine/threonine protein kinase n=1 Tax=Teredinibacter sp. KSP-S5-2 TaxID=3034506 RepID=UPI0029341355|nr:serine/threonine protein kinase [Teredinibacter sp. KSP-S5-2]WNO08712.1 serine/threonine protein kinase [Teredinibacter sp. KSP-S5-2]